MHLKKLLASATVWFISQPMARALAEALHRGLFICDWLVDGTLLRRLGARRHLIRTETHGQTMLRNVLMRVIPGLVGDSKSSTRRQA